mgnify:CR=1 FL=1
MSETAVGIVSDSLLQRHRMQAALEKFGMRIAFCGAPDRLQAQPALPKACLWVVTLEDESDHPELLDHLIEQSEAPVLFGLERAPEETSSDFAIWERRLHLKLEKHLGQLETLDGEAELVALSRDPEPVASVDRLPLPVWITPAQAGDVCEEVWVLGASLGGPGAVKQFLDQLPAGLPIGFVYAQHIDDHFTSVLTQVLGRHASYQLKAACEGEPLKVGEVVLMPVDREWGFDDNGALQRREGVWPGPYGPSIDQVLLNVSACYGARCHAIFFSGMGNDGALAAPTLRSRGSRIWVQSSDSCANSSMPDSVAATGSSSFSGTPQQLAAKLLRAVEESSLLQRRDQRNSEQPRNWEKENEGDGH